MALQGLDNLTVDDRGFWWIDELELEATLIAHHVNLEVLIIIQEFLGVIGEITAI